MFKITPYLLAAMLFVAPGYAEKYYLQPIDDVMKFSDAASYPNKPPDRPGFIWVEGEPPAGATLYQEKTLSEKLDAIFTQLPAAARAQFLMQKAAVKLGIEQGDMEAVKVLIQNTQVPADLDPVKTQMLQLLPAN